MSNPRTTIAAIAGAAALALGVPAIAPHLAPAAAETATSATPVAITTPAPVSPSPATTPTLTPTPSVTTDPATAPTPASGSTGAGATASLTGTVDDDLARGVALITVTTTSGEGAGTGMVLTSDGQVLTNYHVVQGTTDVEVTIASTGDTYAATVLGHDATADVALLQLEGASGLATVTLDDDTLAVGDALTAVGNANGGGELVAASGQVTALEQSVTVSGNEGTEDLSGVIQTNAGAQPGDSGGPMFDAEGEVAGMTTAGGQTVTAGPGGPGGRGRRGAVTGATVTTTAYAVPIEDALAVIEQIRDGAETGTVQIGARAYLGISVQAGGLTVAGVVADGPAEVVGIAAGDRITALDGTTVASQAELSEVLDALEPGDRVSVTWLDASGVLNTETVTLGSSPVN
ncbi:S1C family serine protease [Propioniciclava soli]|uniref:S1C family serine protease n=1 Tax=Propioniciclava soli TaxID=2775081 RepID=UPI001E298EDB|nr:trypsin-like peptidase domain-containing protein [Propioniciclava soli]